MAFYLRPVVASPRYCAPALFSRPTFPTPHDVAPLFSLFDETFAQLERAHRQSRQHFKRPFNPKFDVKESKEAYTLEGELPGFDPKDLSIEFLDDGHTLQIKGKTVKEARQPKAVAASQAEAPKPVEAAPAETKSETSSVRSHQATVEDDVEEPANASAATETEQAQPQQAEQTQTQTVAESSKAAEQPAAEQQQDDTKHWISERYTGSFSRSFKFPSKVNQEAVRASLKDGILAITLPFARKPESRRIQIE